MKKTVTYCLVFAMLCCLFVGCGGGEEESSPPSTTAGTTTVTTADNSAATSGSTPTAATTETGDTMTQGTTASATGKTEEKVTSTTKATTTQANAAVDMDAVFAPILKKNPRVVQMTSYNPTNPAWKNIKAITYDGANIGGSKTKVFAYIGYPEGASAAQKAPAVVLVHGGGGHAFAEWVKLWTDRGYVAIAMDTTGFFPSEAGKGVAGKESDNGNTLWKFGLYGEFAEAGYVNAPNNDDMANPTLPLDRQWMYHAVSSVILAHNVLKADPCVDTAKIGITGISWGCRITSLAIGYDNDFAFAIPVYGGGYEIESMAYGGNRHRNNELTRTYWTAETRFDRVDFPVYWLSWAADISGVTSLNGVSKSYLHTKAAGARLNVKPRWGHSHGQGWAPEDAFLFADSVVMGKPAFTTVTKEPTVKKNADGSYAVTMTIDPADNATKISATAAYLTVPLKNCYDNGVWSGKYDWKAESRSVKVDGNTVTLTLDGKAKCFYIIVSTKTADGKYDVCSQYVEIG